MDWVFCVWTMDDVAVGWIGFSVCGRCGGEMDYAMPI